MLNMLINKKNIKTNPKLNLVFIDEILASFKECNDLKIKNTSSTENIIFTVEITNPIDSIFSLESIIFDLFIDAVGVYMAQATEINRAGFV